MDESPEEIITKIAAVVAVLDSTCFVFWLWSLLSLNGVSTPICPLN